MEENDTINNFTTRITRFVNKVKACRENVMEQYVVTKILCSLTPIFGNIVVAIEESKDLAPMSKEELQRRKDWFIKINRAMKNKVKLANDTILMADGISDVLIMRRDGGNSLIKYILYIQGIKCNLLSIGQLLEKGYKIHMENKGLRVMDANGVLVLKAPMDANRTFKVELKVMEH
ncbi:uncharacterized protein LOC127101799 [Lathyrus oleraceus]|uniref:uncharacterized protein LOC127101799 n=1 Tax=Pisum sativum TaxID=3888 RepID=UPI0021D1CC0E|nr:uncharacterized protein LOC127101799 [Pisum sativum]